MRIACHSFAALVTCFFAAITTSWCQNENDCPLITRPSLEDVIGSVIASGDNPEVPTVSVVDFHPLCLAHSQERGRYRLLSVLVEYTCSGNGNCPTGNAVEQFETECNGGTWDDQVLASSTNTRARNPTANFSTATRDDCAACLSPEFIAGQSLPIATDGFTHCIRCDGCDKGLMQCYGLGSGDCCSYYNDSTCVTACPSPFLPNTEYDCVCPIGTTGHNCSELIDCGSLGNPENGVISVSTTTYNSVVNYSCNTGYTLTGNASQTCLDTGYWSSTEPTCIVVDCGSLGDLENGVISVSTTTYNSVASYSCNTGYTLTGDMLRTCLDTGLWSGSEPTCTVIDCGAPGDPDNGMASVFTTTFNSVANYSCNVRHTLIGDTSRTCLDTGLWSGSEPTCELTGVGENCEPITVSDIERVLSSYLNEENCFNSPTCPIIIDVEEFYINCESMGRMTGTFTHVTVTVNYTLNDALPSDTFIAQADIGCSNVTDQWEANVLRSLASEVDQVLNRSQGTRENRTILHDYVCAACLSPSLARDLLLVSDPVYHCVGCHSACREVGLGWCYGPHSSDCCPYLSDNECVTDCRERREPDEYFQCVCSNSWREPDCIVCDLVCQNGGTPNTADCSQCTCPAGYTGSNCETDVDECSMTGYCVKGTCTNRMDGYDCQCFDGYEGDSCDVNIDDCVSNECLNGGTCVDEVAGFRCECPDQFSGQTCLSCDIANCQSCALVTSQVQCSMCENGYVLNAEGFCSCGIENCVMCDGVPPKCSVCEDGYSLINDLCVCNITNCLKCEGTPPKCGRCEDRYEVADDQCVLKCEVQFCYECSESSESVCKTCRTGYELDAGGCKENRIPSTTDTPTNTDSKETSNRNNDRFSNTVISAIIGGAIILVLILLIIIMLIIIVILKRAHENQNQTKAKNRLDLKPRNTSVKSYTGAKEAFSSVEVGTSREPNQNTYQCL